MAETADTLIKNAIVVTVDEQRRVYTDGYLAFRDGKIVAVGKAADCKIDAKETIDGTGKLVLPGIANAHTHLNQIFLRGYNDDRWPVTDIPKAVATVMRLLNQVTSRTDERRSYVLTRLHCLEMIRAGYTATHDEHFNNAQKRSVDGSWAALRDSGMRGFVARCIIDGPMAPEEGRETVADGLVELERLQKAFGSDRIEVAAGFINYQYRSDPEDMRRIRDGAKAIGARLDIDMTDNSRGANLRKRGWNGGQVEYYRSFDLLAQPIYAGKAVNVMSHEFEILAEQDCRLGIVPILRQFDSVGLPIHHLLNAGLLPGLGTDAPMVSDNQSPFEAMRQAILGQNLAVNREKADGVPPPEAKLWATAETVVEMATRGGARALFMDGITGSLEIGKAADCVIVDTNRPGQRPNFDGRRALGILVWAGDTDMVDTVFVAGKKLLAGGKSTIWNEDDVISEAEQVLREIVAEAGLDALLPDRVAGRSYRGWTYL